MKQQLCATWADAEHHPDCLVVITDDNLGSAVPETPARNEPRPFVCKCNCTTCKRAWWDAGRPIVRGGGVVKQPSLDELVTRIADEKGLGTADVLALAGRLVTQVQPRPPTTPDPFIFTATGQQFQPFAPEVEDIQAEDIALGLAHKCRFSGQTRHFYSVAEHSLRVADLAAAECSAARVYGLLHDAHEAYLADIPTPLKPTLRVGDRSWDQIEQALDEVILKAFRLPPPTDAIKAAVKTADKAVLVAEIGEGLFDSKVAEEFCEVLDYHPSSIFGGVVQAARIQHGRIKARIALRGVADLMLEELRGIK